ncbi:hypothetical protein J437_LFUL002015 [Ladona fulva]|uniref:Ninjurin-1 n=1 Tax=Ladona fulva TaxID=123851 RepID=A0A8K0JUT9_LADFU|nr:hypothetical protein J437_LFUL002015 [Ladona fulva]
MCAFPISKQYHNHSQAHNPAESGAEMHDAGDKEESFQARTNSPELHPLMAVTPLNAASALNNPNGTHTERNAPIRSGIDDGFLPPANPNGGSPRNGEDDEGPTVTPPREGPREREDPGGREWPAREFPVPDLGHIPRGRGGVDINVYAHKKTLAQGMMDLALLSANANQLRYVLDTGPDHPYYYVGLLVVGVGLILNSRYNIRHLQDVRMADIVNNTTVLGIFFVTMLNVFISAFGVGDVPKTPSLPGDSALPDRLVDS